jgi:hypothetical protein
LTDDMTYTVFAPTDGALEAAGIDFMTAEDVLAYIVEGTYLHGELADLVEGTEAEGVVLTSLAGTDIVVRVGQPQDVILDGRAVIALPDTRIDHVIIHTIHDVLGEASAAD